MHLSCSGILKLPISEVVRIDWLLLKQLNLFEEEGKSTDDCKTDGSDED